MGNPGRGKSTILNALSGKQLFKSGTSFGGGLTFQLDEKSCNGNIYLDTPGLADFKLRKQAAESISIALKKGGPYKILFVTTTMSGRVIEEDAVTMKLILDAAPEIGQDFGIIVNITEEIIVREFSNPENLKSFKTQLFAGIAKEHINDNILILQKNDELEKFSWFHHS